MGDVLVPWTGCLITGFATGWHWQWQHISPSSRRICSLPCGSWIMSCYCLGNSSVWRKNVGPPDSGRHLRKQEAWGWAYRCLRWFSKALLEARFLVDIANPPWGRARFGLLWARPFRQASDHAPDVPTSLFIVQCPQKWQVTSVILQYLDNILCFTVILSESLNVISSTFEYLPEITLHLQHITLPPHKSLPPPLSHWFW